MLCSCFLRYLRLTRPHITAKKEEVEIITTPLESRLLPPLATSEPISMGKTIVIDGPICKNSGTGCWFCLGMGASISTSSASHFTSMRGERWYS